MKTKLQKQEEINNCASALKSASTAIIADHTGLSSNDINALRKLLFAFGAKVIVLKKRLLKRVLESLSLDTNASLFSGHVGVIVSASELHDISKSVVGFAKKHKEVFKVLGGFELREKKYLDGTVVTRIGELPSREVLLGQLVGMIASPLRSFMYVLSERAKKIG